MNIRYRVTLSSDERSQLLTLIAGGKAAVRKVKRAQILLAAAAGSTDEAIAANVGVGTATVYRTKERLVTGGLDRALNEMARPSGQLHVPLTVSNRMVSSGPSRRDLRAAAVELPVIVSSQDAAERAHAVADLAGCEAGVAE